jgi:hypothetical protein
VRVASDGATVIWDSWTSSFGEALPPPLHFDLSQYEAALTSAESRSWESEERRFAKRVARLIDRDVESALMWRGLRYLNVVPAGDGLVAVRLAANHLDGEWSVYVIARTSQDPASVRHMLSRRGPTAWPNVFWWGENEAATLRQPPMAGRRWRMWDPTEV